MKLSISNIAWAKEDDDAVYALLSKHKYNGIDIAPSRIWSDIYNVTLEQATDFRSSIYARGLEIGGMQSLLFQKPDLTIFDSEEKRNETQDALKKMIELGGVLGVRGIVFGSPKNRIMGSATDAKWQIAEDFFRALGEYAHAKGVYFCIEPNPTIYGGDFLTKTGETFDFVKRVNSPGLKVNLDMGTMIENGEDPLPFIEKDLQFIGHVHVSMPYLKPIVMHEVHKTALHALKHFGYTGWVAIEMAKIEGEDRLKKIEDILQDVSVHAT